MSKKLFGKFFIILLVMGLLFAVAPTGQAEAATLDVCSTCTYTTIQAAINAAGDGDTISVGPGTYVEAIVINKPNLTVQSTDGADTTIIDASGAVMAVQLENNLGTLTFNGFSVTNFTDIGIAQSMSKPNTIFHVLNNKVVATGDFLRNGINVSGSGSTIIGNTVIGATYDNPSYGSSGIIVVNASNVMIQNNNISGTPEYGITINNWSNTTPMTGIVVSGNTITGADYGVLIWANDTFSIDGVTLTGNTITDYSAPVAVFGTVSNVSTLPPVANITSGDYFYTIQEAIDAATAEDVIQVAAGSYAENLTINKALTLQGAGSKTTTVTGVAPATDAGVLRIMASDVTVEGFKFVAIGNKTVRITDPTSNVTLKNNHFVGAANTALNTTFTLLETDYNEVQTNHVITGNTFEANGVQQAVYYNPTTPGLTFTNNTFTGTIKDGGVGVVVEALSGTYAISDNNFTGLGGNPYGMMGLPGLTPAQMDAIFLANTFPAGYAVVGTDILIPPTKLNMSPATFATTDTCTGTYEAFVNVVDVTDLVAYTLNLTYDADLITVTKVENVGFVGGTAEPLNTFAGGNIKFGWSVLGGAGEPVTITGDKSLIKITFQSKGLAGAAAFAIDAANSMLVHWDDVQPIPFEVTGGAAFNFGAVVKNVQTTTEYCALSSAYTAAAAGNTLQLMANINLTEPQVFGKSLTLDMNGFNVTRDNATSETDYLFAISKSKILTVVGAGTLTSTNTDGTFGTAVYVQGGTLNLTDATISGGYSSAYLVPSGITGGKLIMNSGTLSDGLVVFSYGNATINGGTVTTQAGGLAPISGNSAQPTTNITINGGTITSPIGTAIYHPQAGNLNINGGTITGATGIEMRAGTLTIADDPALAGVPTITGTAGDAIFMNGNFTSGYTGLLSATISGGEFTSTGGYALHETAPATTRTSNIAVSGGKFTGSLGAVSFTTVDPLVLKLTDGAYNTDPGATPDYVFEPLDTYLNTTDNYYYIDTIISGTIAAYDLPNGTETVTGDVVDLYGEIPWYPYQGGEFVRPQGNRVGVYITEPTGVDLSGATIEIVANGAPYYSNTWALAKDHLTDNYVPYWPLVDAIFPDVFTITVQWNPVSTQVFTVNVLEGSTLQLPPAPVISSTDIQGYYLVGDPQEFHVTLTNPTPGAIYSHVIFKVSVAADAGDLSLKYWENTTSQFLDLPLTCAGGTCTTYYGPATGFPIGQGYTATSLFELTAAVAGNYPFTITLEDLDTDPDTVLATYTNTGVVYPKPVISSTELAGPFQQGQEATVTINVDNVGLMNTPNSFILHLDLPEGTVVVYGGVTYTCTATGCDIPVTLAAGSNAIDLDITFNAPYNAPITVTLVDTIAEPDRTLATFTTPSNVVVYGNVASVTGTISMQGRLTTAGVPVTLTGTLGFGPYTVPSVEGASGNLTFTDLVVGTYTITTNQPRYLNITADMAKVINIAKDTDIAALRLRGGNAIWENDNVIDNLDLGKVTLGYTAGITSHPDADVNFDNRINIQDLALVGGNYNLTSAGAYGTWQP